MKKALQLMSICLMIMGIFITPIHAREAFTIDDLHIAMRVDEDGTYYVEEEYTLDFTEHRHGFYRTIPTKYEMKWTDETSGEAKYRNYYFPIDHISCGDADTCDIEVDSGSVMIQIGDPDRTVIGKQRYTISYQVHTRDLDMDGAQMVYWNLIGNGFDTVVKKMTYTIDMPKDFDEERISAYTGAYGAAYQNLTHTVNDTRIEGELTTMLRPNESATIMIPLEDGYFQFPEVPDYLLYAIIATVVITLVSLVLFFCYGKDDEVVVTVEFQAPDGLDSAAVGYIVDGYGDHKDILSLIIDWARRGYIKIHEDENHHLKLEKLRDMETSDTKPYERTFFHAVFKQKDLVSESDLKAVSVGQGLQRACKSLSDYFHAKPRRIYTGSSLFLQVLMCLMLALPSCFCAMGALYMHYGMMEMTFPAFIIAIFALVAGIPWIFLMRRRYVMKKHNYLLLWGLCFFFHAVIMAVCVILMVVMGSAWRWLYAAIYVIAQMIQLLVLMFMDKRTKQGNRWLGQILGLREFILHCEKDRIELLARENPSAFFDVLPYAYVLGVSDVWASKFEDLIIPQPEWYVSANYYDGFTSWIWWNSFHRSFHHISRSMTFSEPQQGGSFGSGGGSFGGFSGGGFSGGGFGGGGGGSW